MSNHEKSSEDIRREIEHTRSELGNTVDAIQDRLKPDNLRAQAQEAIQGTLTDTADSIVNYVTGHRSELQSSLMETVKRNPLPSLLIGAGVGWLLVDMLSSSRDDAGYPSQRYDRDGARTFQRTGNYEQSGVGYSSARYANPNGDRYNNGPQGNDENWAKSALHTVQDKVGDVAGAVHDAAAQAGGAIQDAATNAGDALQGAAAKVGGGVQETTGAMGDKAQRSAGQMGNQAQSYARTTQRTISDNPLLFSAIALGAGAAVALLLPHTRQEDEWMGELRDQVTGNATAAAKDVAERARSVVEEVAPEVKQAVQRVAEEVKQTGQESLEQVKKSTAEAVDKVQNQTESTLKSEAEKAEQDMQRQAQDGKEAVTYRMNQ
jgi:ElaB/YqjD/DUF883 family membrane-anchored ribosome-binding protein